MKNETQKIPLERDSRALRDAVDREFEGCWKLTRKEILEIVNVELNILEEQSRRTIAALQEQLNNNKSVVKSQKDTESTESGQKRI